MTGIDRLRAIAGAWDEWGLGGELAEIADEIERERAEDCYRMGLDCGTVWRVVADMERHCLGHEGMEDSPVARWARELREALGGEEHDHADEREIIAWVRERGGLSDVRLCHNAADNRRAELCSALGIDLETGWSDAMAVMRPRLMPEGYEWPRYESGDLVMFGDCVENRNGTCTVNSVRFYSGGGVSVYGEDRGAQFVVVTEPVMHDPIRKANPKVFAADGEPLEAGQTVYDVDAEADTPLTVVEVSSDLVRCEYTWKDGKTYRPCYPPDQLTHQRPVLDAEGDRIEPAMDVWWVCEGDERGVHAEKLHVDGIDEDGMVECSPYNGGTSVVLEPSELYVNRPVLDADGVPICEGDTVYDKDSGDRFEVDGFSYDCVVCTDIDMCESDIEIFPSQLTHTKPEIDSWQRIEEDARLKPFGYVDRVLGWDMSKSHSQNQARSAMAHDLVRRARALAECDR